MLKRLFLITGSPSVGKTTVLMKAVDDLRDKGYSVGGMISQDVRSRGNRVGFEILDVGSGRRGCLASVYQKEGPWVGKYRVSIADLNSVGAQAVLNAVDDFDVVVVDEIGPVEMFSEKFRNAVEGAVESMKPALFTIHWKMSNALIDGIKERTDAELHVVTRDNREHLHEVVVRKTIGFLMKADSE